MNWIEFFFYDESSPSCLRWRIRPNQSVRAGDPAGSIENTGYWRVRFRNKTISCHRIIWEMFNGLIEPKMEIDHKNGNTLDNKICNLRLATKSQNLGNRGINKNNQSGCKGVHWYKPTNRWVARIGFNGKRVHLGYFVDKDEAVLVYKNKSIELFGEYSKENRPAV